MKMMNAHVDVDDALRETAPHGDSQFPVSLHEIEFDTFINRQINWHWHPELELCLAVRGDTELFVGQEQFVLHPGQGIFINANVMHMARAAHGSADVTLLACVFSSRLLESDAQSSIYEKSIQPIVECATLSSLFLSGNALWERESLANLRAISLAWRRSASGRELRIRNLLCEAWLSLSENFMTAVEEPAEEGKSTHGSSLSGLRALKMLQYVHAHYMEETTIEDIAASANISRSECFRTFQTVLHQRPIAYLINHRIAQAQQLLADSVLSITDIAIACGFNHTSYFCRLFHKKTGLTPTQYRKTVHKHA